MECGNGRRFLWMEFPFERLNLYSIHCKMIAIKFCKYEGGWYE